MIHTCFNFSCQQWPFNSINYSFLCTHLLHHEGILEHSRKINPVCMCSSSITTTSLLWKIYAIMHLGSGVYTYINSETKIRFLRTFTRGSAIAEEPRDALRQLKYYGRFLTELLTRSSANPGEPCEHTVSWNRVKCCTNVRRIAFENVCNRWMTFKVTAVATIW